MRYQIGHFSLLTKLPVKTLRYYHEVGLLEPDHVDACKDALARISSGEPIAEDEITCRVVPDCDGIATIHEGAYERLGDAYQLLFDYAGDHDLEVHVPIRERYLRGAGDSGADPAEYRTQIVVPVTG